MKSYAERLQESAERDARFDREMRLLDNLWLGFVMALFLIMSALLVYPDTCAFGGWLISLLAVVGAVVE